MSDPNITIIERPVYEEESVNFGQLNLQEFKFNFGVYIVSWNEEYEGEIEIPESIGRIRT